MISVLSLTRKEETIHLRTFPGMSVPVHEQLRAFRGYPSLVSKRERLPSRIAEEE